MAKKSLLGLDLNEIANKAIQEKINELEVANKSLHNKLNELSKENHSLNNELESIKEHNQQTLSVFEGFRKTYKDLEPVQGTRDSYGKNINQVRYGYIVQLMKLVYGVSTNHTDHFGGLATNLAVAFYNNRPELISILNLLNADGDQFLFSGQVIAKIRDFVMPYDYSKEKILEYVKNPRYNTNFCMRGIEALTQYGCIPHDIIQQSPFIADEDIFEELIQSIEKKRGESYMLFEVYKNNKSITDEHIRVIGRYVLENLPQSGRSSDMSDSVKNFLKDNLTKLETDTVDKLFELYCSHDNQFKLLHWENFPIEYQYKYLLGKSFSEVLKITNNYSCKWTDEQKEEFYGQYFYKLD